jgi:glycosyltransferase involved in cell wall biosynthesis
MITVIMLTFNEEVHVARALNSVSEIAQRVVVVDSGSTDETRKIAANLGAEVLQNPWTNHAAQFNWALDQLKDDTNWILRLDADEIVTPALAKEITGSLDELHQDVAGVTIGRRITFLGRPIRHGGIFPIKVLRLFRNGRGRSENRWMDEHIKVAGETVDFKGEIVDDNLNSLTWWTEKHNNYASREVIDLLNLEYQFMPCDAAESFKGGQQAGVKRWVKERIYARLPGGVRAFAYFFYRYVIRLGFLDGREGAAFHILQGFWYRFLVDAKLHEVRTYMTKHKVDPATAIDKVLEVKIN